MTQRWWAPQRPTIEPDRVVLALLEPGGDPAGDLGNALLAMHRAGAAACEAVAKGAVPSEYGLVNALATCRAALAPPAVDTISKSMEGSYAGLLVRDVLDDAEDAAVALFRSCVAKGVSPPIAASRVGAVYGVPSKELGKYWHLATDPRVNPVALTDAADRTLLGYVSKVVAEEAGDIQPVKEAVSKSPTGHARELGDSEEGWTEREHPRDRTTGRFVHGAPRGGPPVREGQVEPIIIPGIEVESPLDRIRRRLGLGGTAPRVADQPAVAPTKPAPPKQRQQRQQRQQRTMRQRPQAQTAPTRQQARQTASQSAIQRVKTKVQAANQRARQWSRQTANQGSKVAGGHKEVVPVVTRDWKGTALERVDDTGSYQPIRLEGSQELVFTLTPREARGLIRTMPKVEGGDDPERPHRLVRAHAIQNVVPQAGPEIHNPDEPNSPEHRAAMAAVRSAAEEVKADLDPSRYQGLGVPTTHRIAPDDELIEGSLEKTELRYRTLMSEDVGTAEDGTLASRLMLQAFEGSVGLPELGDVSVHWVVVPTESADGTYELPIVDQFYIADEVMGEVDRGSPSDRHLQVHLDRNQAFMMTGEAQQFWDPQNKVVVNRWRLDPVREDEVEILTDPDTGKLFGKALEPHDAVRFEQQHPRDSEGRFAETATRTSGIAPLQIPSVVEQFNQQITEQEERTRTRQQQPLQRQQRQQRQMRQAKAKPVVRQQARQTAGQTGRVETSVSVQQTARQEAMARAFAPKAEQRRQMPVLDDRSNYTVLTQAEFSKIVALTPDIQDRGVITLPGSARARLLQAGQVNGAGAIGAINLNLEEDITRREGPASKGYVWNRRPVGRGSLRTQEDDFRMGLNIRQIFERFPSVAQVHIDYVEHPGEYVLYANNRPANPQVLIEIDEDLDMDAPMVLLPLGEYQTTEMLHRRRVGEGPENYVDTNVAATDATMFNAKMHQFRLQNAPVQRYRLQNDD